MKRDFKTSLQEHSMEVVKLAEVAYADLPPANRRELALEAFLNTINNSYLHRHLLAVAPRSIDVAVRAGNEYLQVKLPSQHHVPLK